MSTSWDDPPPPSFKNSQLVFFSNEYFPKKLKIHYKKHMSKYSVIKYDCHKSF